MKFFTYKGYPLVRKDKELYFGNMYDEYVVWMQILETEKQQNMEVASLLGSLSAGSIPTGMLIAAAIYAASWLLSIRLYAKREL